MVFKLCSSFKGRVASWNVLVCKHILLKISNIFLFLCRVDKDSKAAVVLTYRYVNLKRTGNIPVDFTKTGPVQLANKFISYIWNRILQDADISIALIFVHKIAIWYWCSTIFVWNAYKCVSTCDRLKRNVCIYFSVFIFQDFMYSYTLWKVHRSHGTARKWF